MSVDVDARFHYLRLVVGKSGGLVPKDSGFGRGGEYERKDYPPESIRAWAEAGNALGVRTGSAGGGIVVLDLDVGHGWEKDGLASMAALVAKHGDMPRTFTVRTGRGGKHAYFLTPKGYVVRNQTDAFWQNSGIDVRGEGGYVVAPGSIHPRTGKVYEVEDDSPMVELPAWMLSRVAEKDDGSGRGPVRHSEPLKVPDKVITPPDCCKALSVRAVKRLLADTRELAGLDEGQRLMIAGAERGWEDGTGFYVLACRLAQIACWQYATLTPEHAGRLFIEAAAPYPNAERTWDNALAAVVDEHDPWTVGERHRTEAHGPKRLRVGSEPYSALAGTRPQVFVAEYLDRHHRDADGRLLLRFMDETFWRWTDHYRLLKGSEVSAMIARDLDGVLETALDGQTRPLDVTRRIKAELTSALSDQTLVFDGDLLPPTGGVPFRNGWLDVRTGLLTPLTPDRDVRWMVDSDYDPNAAEPTAWFAFLDSIGYGEGTPERRLLRQWFGYVLSGDCSQHKGLMMVGPPRAGKGTVLRVAEALLGQGAVGISIANFGEQFGLEPLLGKGLATVDDARFALRTDRGAVEKLLSTIAHGTVQVNRKHKVGVSVRVGARLMIATNEVPGVIEASPALASRFIFLPFTESFLGREDLDLEPRLLVELPGIAKWALAGRDDLERVGRFVETEAGIDMRQDMEFLGNPIRAFVEDKCELDPVCWTPMHDVYVEYVVWAEARHQYVPNEQWFTRDMMTAFPQLQRTRQRVSGGPQKRGFRGIRLV